MLTVDLGNSRLKASRWRRNGGAFERLDGWEGDGGALEGFARWLARERARLAALASVAALEHTERVRALLVEGCERVLVAPPSGLENRCREPERVGVDRLYAAAGATA